MSSWFHNTGLCFLPERSTAPDTLKEPPGFSRSPVLSTAQHSTAQHPRTRFILLTHALINVPLFVEGRQREKPSGKGAGDSKQGREPPPHLSAGLSLRAAPPERRTLWFRGLRFSLGSEPVTRWGGQVFSGCRFS
ncbi:hypothetical protein SKAU_G00323710 [Synaphobranchus kaupii]|uniref:Uncharacterized protein n=1 Tax=Synaphobranchus kaupii TaxID=118154 RepID=A0A9Q1EP66_SYNKA|nr:hypothetical protein SKAU_G00323710 [Synaphobranchus kaupii]